MRFTATFLLTPEEKQGLEEVRKVLRLTEDKIKKRIRETPEFKGTLAFAAPENSFSGAKQSLTIDAYGRAEFTFTPQEEFVPAPELPRFSLDHSTINALLQSRDLSPTEKRRLISKITNGLIEEKV